MRKILFGWPDDPAHGMGNRGVQLNRRLCLVRLVVLRQEAMGAARQQGVGVGSLMEA